MSSHKSIQIAGITLVEVMIAIVIFGVWILSILKVLGNNILIIQHTRLKTQATLLAKEWIELVYNLRDSNLDRSFDWNCGKIIKTQPAINNLWWESVQTSSYDCDPGSFLQWNKSYTISYDSNHHYQINIAWPTDGKLYYGDNNILSHLSSPNPSPFTRLIHIDSIQTDMNYSSGGLIYQITSTVTYKSHNGSWSISLQSLIGLTR